MTLRLNNKGSGNPIDGNPKAGSSTSGIMSSALVVITPKTQKSISPMIIKK